MKNHLYDALPLENQLSGQQPVGDAAERVEGGAVNGLGGAEHHFGRHERGGAAGAAVLAEVEGVVVRSAGGVELYQTEVEHLGKIEGRSRPTDHHVRWLDVAMHQAILMRVLK